jgi:hypothetical protein
MSDRQIYVVTQSYISSSFPNLKAAQDYLLTHPTGVLHPPFANKEDAYRFRSQHEAEGERRLMASAISPNLIRPITLNPIWIPTTASIVDRQRINHWGQNYYVLIKGKYSDIFTDINAANREPFIGSSRTLFDNLYDAESYESQWMSSYGPFRYVPKDGQPYPYVPLEQKSIVFTDGSYGKGIDCACGFGIVILTTDQVKYTAYGRITQDLCCASMAARAQGSIIAELYAIYVAASLILGDIILYTDSLFAINYLTIGYPTLYEHKDKYDANGFNVLLSIRQFLERRPGTIEFRKVNSYSRFRGAVEHNPTSREARETENYKGIRLNLEADYLASWGRRNTDRLIVMRDNVRVR